MIMKLWWSNWVFLLLRGQSNFHGGHMYYESVWQVIGSVDAKNNGEQCCLCGIIGFFCIMYAFVSVFLSIIWYPLGFFPQYAHRKCVQHWCNEKGDIICEICHKVWFFYMRFSHLGEFCLFNFCMVVKLW